jgi:hypothetical protein
MANGTSSNGIATVVVRQKKVKALRVIHRASGTTEHGDSVTAAARSMSLTSALRGAGGGRGATGVLAGVIASSTQTLVGHDVVSMLAGLVHRRRRESDAVWFVVSGPCFRGSMSLCRVLPIFLRFRSWCCSRRSKNNGMGKSASSLERSSRPPPRP